MALAEKEAASLIVVGSTGPRSSLLGSISADVSRRASCPVVVVAPGAALSLTNGNGDRTYTGREREARDVVGGIIRFSLGGGKR